MPHARRDVRVGVDRDAATELFDLPAHLLVPAGGSSSFLFETTISSSSAAGARRKSAETEGMSPVARARIWRLRQPGNRGE
jgi:hypothetical protein